MIRKLSLILLVIVLAGCTGSFYEPPTGGEQVKLRAVTDLPGNTNISIGSRDSCEKSTFARLGWFHPGAGQSMQASRRGFDRREGMPHGDEYRDHMYSEQRVLVEQQPRVFVDNITGFTVGSFSNLDFCNGFYDVDMEAGLDYEIYAKGTETGCELVAYRLSPKGFTSKRTKIEVSRVCTQ